MKLRITIDTPEGIPSVWRELAISGEATLTELSDALQAAFGWAGIHKHEFVGTNGSWKATDPQYGPPEFDDSYANEEEVVDSFPTSSSTQRVVGNWAPAINAQEPFNSDHLSLS